MTQTSPLLPIY